MRGNRGIFIGRIFVLTSAAHYLLSCADYNQFKQQAELKKKKKKSGLENGKLISQRYYSYSKSL